MSGVNKAILIGNLGADPETRYTQSGDAVTTIRVATSESWKDKNTGQKQERTEWHSVVMWRGLAEIAGKYLIKGSKVYIEGKLQTRKWQAQDGSDRYSTEIVAHTMQMLDARRDSVPSAREEAGQAFQSTIEEPRQPAQAGADFDDDIPF